MQYIFTVKMWTLNIVYKPSPKTLKGKKTKWNLPGESKCLDIIAISVTSAHTSMVLIYGNYEHVAHICKGKYVFSKAKSS